MQIATRTRRDSLQLGDRAAPLNRACCRLDLAERIRLWTTELRA
jgi:hypothetical protein